VQTVQQTATRPALPLLLFLAGCTAACAASAPAQRAPEAQRAQEAQPAPEAQRAQEAQPAQGATQAAPTAPAPVAAAPVAPAALAATPAPATPVAAAPAAPVTPPPAGAAAPPAPAGASADEEGEAAEGDEGEDSPESESRTAQATGPDVSFTRDLSNDELARRWQHDLPSLGSISVGFADEGRLINGLHMPKDEAWICARPDLAWGTKEAIDGLTAAFRAVREQFPDSAPARLSHIGQREGGYLRPHRSHQSGRDADIGLFYKGDRIPGGRARRDKFIDPARNWALLRALLTQADVQVVLVDRGIQKVLKKHALAIGEDPAWVEQVFRPGKDALVQHARRHRDHFHVRFYAPRSQELGRRIQPLLAQRPDQNLTIHRVKRGQTLGSIARHYKTSVHAIQKANRMRRTLLSVGQRLLVPLRGPCTRCPLPPPVVVPPRRLPPQQGGTLVNTAGIATQPQ
jgi:murein endopeptidase